MCIRDRYRGYLQLAALDMLDNRNVRRTLLWDPLEPVAARPLAPVSYTHLDVYKRQTQTTPSGATFVTRNAPDGTVLEESGTGQRHICLLYTSSVIFLFVNRLVLKKII